MLNWVNYSIKMAFHAILKSFMAFAKCRLRHNPSSKSYIQIFYLVFPLVCHLSQLLLQIVSAGNFKQPLEYTGGNFGSISIQAQEQGGMQKTVKLSLKGLKLDKKDFFG